MSENEFLVLGAGMMGRAIAYDIVQSRGRSSLAVIDADPQACQSLEDWLDIDVYNQDVNSPEIDQYIENSKSVICALPYGFNLNFMKKAISAGAHFCDLGGNDDIVRKQLDLDARARDAGVLCLPDCGLAPGMANVLGAYLASKFDTPDELTIRVGGLPQHPKPPLNYQLVFSVGGLINEYKEKTELTVQKLFTTITTALRSYRDLRIIEKNRVGLEQIIHSSGKLFEKQSLKEFAGGVLILS